MAKQVKGRGSVSYEKGRKKWRAQFVADGKRYLKRFDTQREAVEYLSSQCADIADGTFVAPSSMILGEWIYQWLKDYKKASLSQRTYERYIELARHLLPLAEIRLQELTAPHVQQLYTELLKTLSASTVGKIHRVLSSALKKALQTGMVGRNVMDAVEPPRQPAKGDIITFSRTELTAIISAAQNNRYYAKYVPLLRLAMTTGARLGELLALRECDINRESHEIRISRNVQTTRHGIIINPPKTKAGMRTITVPAAVIDAIEPAADDALLFGTRDGKPFAANNIERVWRKIVALTDVPYRNFHVFRHTHATDLLAAGVPIVEVARRLGHARVSHTLELYGHAIPRYDKEIAAKVADIYLGG